MSTQQPSATKLYSLGVLFVHGLGDHTRGATLTHWGQALIQCIDHWIEGGNLVTAHAHQLVNMKTIGASIESQDGERQDPPYAIVEFADKSKELEPQLNEECWLLAESHWDSSYPPPAYAELVLWAVDALPWTILTHVNKTLRRAEYGLQAGTNGWWRLIRAYSLLLVTLMLSPLVLFVVVLLSVVGALPIPYVNTFVAAAQRRLANTIGDSYVLVGNPISGEVIYSRLLRDLTWLCERCDAVAVIAHSQGAAVAHRVIRNNPDTPEVQKIKLLITFGQGLSKLNSIVYRRGPEAFSSLWGSILSILAVALASIDLIFNLKFAAGRFAESIVKIVTFDIFDGIGIAYWLGAIIGSSLIVVLGRYGTRRSLKPLRWVNQITPAWINWAVLFIMGITIVAHVLNNVQPGQDHDINEPSRLLVLLVVFVGVICSHSFMRMWERANQKELGLDAQKMADQNEFQAKYELGELPWHDYYTRKDIVANGPLLDSFAPGIQSGPEKFESIEVYNRGNLVDDHSWYWQNIEEFTYPVSHALVSLPKNSPPSSLRKTDPNLQRAIDDRTSRVWRLLLVNWALVGIFIAIGGLLLVPILDQNLASIQLPEILYSARSVALTVVNWTLLPKLLSGVAARIVGDNAAAATLVTYGAALLFLYSFLKLVIHILWMIWFERTGRRNFYEQLPRKSATA